nr:MAG TPA: hypothetical protein [Caudoviricetes sp.]
MTKPSADLTPASKPSPPSCALMLSQASVQD